MGEDQHAKTMFETLCKVLDRNDIRYNKKEEEYRVECVFIGEDLPIHISIIVDAEYKRVILFSQILFSTPKSRIIDIAAAICFVNSRLIHGNFVLDMQTGNITFRMVNTFYKSLLSEEVLIYIIRYSNSIIDQYNDRFLMLIKGYITMKQFAIKDIKDKEQE